MTLKLKLPVHKRAQIIQWILWLTTFVLAILIPTAIILYPGWVQRRRYRRLYVGMSIDALRQVFKRKPDATVFIRGQGVVYIYHEGFFKEIATKSRTSCAALPREVPSLRELRLLYYLDVGVFIDTTGKVRAYQLGGESCTWEDVPLGPRDRRIRMRIIEDTFRGGY